MDLDTELTDAGMFAAAAFAPDAVAVDGADGAAAGGLTASEDPLSNDNNTNTSAEISGFAEVTNMDTRFATVHTSNNAAKSTALAQSVAVSSQANDKLFKTPVYSLRSDQSREKTKRNTTDDANSSDCSAASTSSENRRAHHRSKKKPKALTDTSQNTH